MGSKIKHNWRLSRPEAADLLRKLADALEEGVDELSPYGLSFAELIKFKIKIDLDEEDSLEVKFSGKGFRLCGSPTPCGSDEAVAASAGRKKRIAAYFNAMCESMEKKEMPSSEIVSVFLADSEQMFDGHDESEMFFACQNLCEQLRQATTNEDIAEMDRVLKEMEQLKDIYLSERP